MTQLEKEFFDYHVYGTFDPHINKIRPPIKKPHPVETKQQSDSIRQFALQICAMEDAFDKTDAHNNAQAINQHLKEILDVVSAEFGPQSQFANDIRAAIAGSSDYCSIFLRIKTAFDI